MKDSVETIKDYLKSEGSLAGLSLAEGNRVKGYMEYLIGAVEIAACHGCGNDLVLCKCDCHDKSPFHISSCGHNESACACSGSGNCNCG